MECFIIITYLQFMNSISNFSGVILVGPSGSGKSACVQALIDALCVNPRGMSRQSNSNAKAGGPQQAESNHRLLKINPCVVDDYQTMFGYLSHQGDWVDGIFTHSWRKANRVSMSFIRSKPLSLNFS